MPRMLQKLGGLNERGQVPSRTCPPVGATAQAVSSHISGAAATPCKKKRRRGAECATRHAIAGTTLHDPSGNRRHSPSVLSPHVPTTACSGNDDAREVDDGSGSDGNSSADSSSSSSGSDDDDIGKHNDESEHERLKREAAILRLGTWVVPPGQSQTSQLRLPKPDAASAVPAMLTSPAPPASVPVAVSAGYLSTSFPEDEACGTFAHQNRSSQQQRKHAYVTGTWGKVGEAGKSSASQLLGRFHAIKTAVHQRRDAAGAAKAPQVHEDDDVATCLPTVHALDGPAVDDASDCERHAAPAVLEGLTAVDVPSRLTGERLDAAANAARMAPSLRDTTLPADFVPFVVLDSMARRDATVPAALRCAACCVLPSTPVWCACCDVIACSACLAPPEQAWCCCVCGTRDDASFHRVGALDALLDVWRLLAFVRMDPYCTSSDAVCLPVASAALTTSE